MRRVFLSYSRKDALKVGDLYEDLESLGHKAWRDRDLDGGQTWWDEILKQIRECEAFVVAVSASSIDSKACLSEFEYAVALHRPVLPVMIEADVSDSMMPPALAALQRVNYTQADKQALAALFRGFAKLADAPALPTPLPKPPKIPASYIYDLRSKIEAEGTLSPAEQDALLRQLKSRGQAGQDPRDLLALCEKFRERPEVLASIDRELGELADRLRASREKPERPGPPRPPAPQPVAPPGPELSEGLKKAARKTLIIVILTIIGVVMILQWIAGSGDF